MAPTLKPASTLLASRSPIVDKDGNAMPFFAKMLQGWDIKLQNLSNQFGQLIGEIDARTKITGRSEGIGVTVQHVDDTGVVLPPGLSPATDTAHGAVILPSGAASTTLGSAALQPDTAFDPVGAAATAQTNAQTFATAAANAAQSNAVALASNASNLTSGTVPIARLPGMSGIVTEVTAALTVGGAQGSNTYTNGLLTARVQAT